MSFKKIVISKWLQEIAGSLGEKAEYIPNGLDFDEFGMDISPSDRKPEKVMMLYNELKFKGSQTGIDAISELKNKIENLEAVLFGVPERPLTLPDWMEYHQSPGRKLLRRLYNECSVFVSPSLTEGFGLTAAEAMMCGAALAASDTGGHREFAISNETALLFEPGNSEQLKDRVQMLIDDKELRTRLALSGNKFIQRFTWDKAVDKFEEVLQES
jgi:glycosyltransferase involved in cell wall biosynthesis